MALTPLYNYVFMALPVMKEDLRPLYNEIISFLWTRSANSETIKKRWLVSKRRLSASFGLGGLQIPHPSETAEA
jgi:hypothetical protein